MSTSSEESIGNNVLNQAEKTILNWAIIGNLTHLVNDMVVNNPEDLNNFHPLMQQVTTEINNQNLLHRIFEDDEIIDMYFDMKLAYYAARSRMWHNHLKLIDMRVDEQDLIIAFTNMKYIP